MSSAKWANCEQKGLTSRFSRWYHLNSSLTPTRPLLMPSKLHANSHICIWSWKFSRKWHSNETNQTYEQIARVLELIKTNLFMLKNFFSISLFTNFSSLEKLNYFHAEWTVRLLNFSEQIRIQFLPLKCENLHFAFTLRNAKLVGIIKLWNCHYFQCFLCKKKWGREK